nr:MAG TPA_asm: hypothetical protein [Caudoviricetes sp.]DAT90164.1 MAG TPA: hypothetical protein [Caudoviricetes sp.]
MVAIRSGGLIPVPHNPARRMCASTDVSGLPLQTPGIRT